MEKNQVLKRYGFWLAGVLEIDPCFAWQQQVMAGVGVASDVKALYKDMHTYLKGMNSLESVQMPQLRLNINFFTWPHRTQVLHTAEAKCSLQLNNKQLSFQSSVVCMRVYEVNKCHLYKLSNDYPTLPTHPFLSCLGHLYHRKC